MILENETYRCWALMFFFCLAGVLEGYVWGQTKPRAAMKREKADVADTVTVRQNLLVGTDSVAGLADSIALENERQIASLSELKKVSLPEETDSLSTKKMKVKTFVPNPTKATWLAIVLPGAGQIYNHKYWKLPIFYGGFAGCAYALTWNGNMYTDYQNAYRDAVKGNWKSPNITDLLPQNYLDRVPPSQVTEILRKRKDTYRRFRDLSIFAFAAVYLLSIVDAYVDAELSNFDLSPDLSVHLGPSTIDTSHALGKSKNIGLQCSLRF